MGDQMTTELRIDKRDRWLKAKAARDYARMMVERQMLLLRSRGTE